MNTSLRCALVALMLSATMLPSAVNASVANVLQSFPTPRLLAETQVTEPQQFWWLQSAVKRVGNDYLADREERIEIQRLRTELYELSSQYSEQTIYHRIIESWKAEGYEELYSCSAVSCGSSQHWAVHVFDIPTLYGLNRNQFYSTGLINGDIRVLYVVRRGTQTNYVYWQEASQRGNVERLPAYLLSGMAVPVEQFEADYWSVVLADNPDWVVTLVGHDYSADLSEALLQGRERATRVAETWRTAGIAEAQIRVESVGYLAPDGANPTPKVKVILSPSFR